MTCAVTVLCHLMLVNFSPLQTNIETAKRNVDAVSNHEQSQSSASLQTHQSNEANDVHEHHFDEQWFDIWQRSFTDSMDFTVKQFDGWFHSGDSGAKQLGEQARAEGRIQLAWEPRSGDFADTDLRFRIRVKLPALTMKMKPKTHQFEPPEIPPIIIATRPPLPCAFAQTRIHTTLLE